MTLVSRVSGLAQSVFLAHFLGAGAAADAFFVAFRLPNLLRRFSAEGTMTAAFLPTIVEVEARHGEAAARQTAARFLGTLALLLSAFVCLAMAAMGVIVGVLVMGRLQPAAPWSQQIAALVKVVLGRAPVPPEVALTITLSRIMFPYLVLVSVTAGFAAILNLRHRFALAASISTLWNIVFIAFAWVAIRRSGAVTADQVAVVCAVAVVVGGVFQLAVLWVAARRFGFGLDLRLHLRDELVRRILRRMGPGLLAAGIYPVNALLSTVLASRLPQGSQTVLFNSGMMGEMVLGVFAMGLVTASLPLLSRQAAAGELDDLRGTLGTALRSAALLAVPASVGMAVLSRPIVMLIFGSGRYGPEAITRTAQTLVFTCPGLLFAASQRIGTQALYALNDYRGPVASAMLALVTNVVVSLALLGPLGTRGLALANGVASVVGMLFLFGLLDRRLGKWPKAAVAQAWLRMIGAAALMGLAAARGADVLDLVGSRVAISLKLSVLMSACALLYMACLLAVGDRDMRGLWRRFVVRRQRS
jgi:putative peptidoglycan lipid II flippase